MKLENIAVLGAGTSGKGIIRSLAGAGLQVIFCEINEEKVRRVVEDISDSPGSGNRALVDHWRREEADPESHCGHDGHAQAGREPGGDRGDQG